MSYIERQNEIYQKNINLAKMLCNGVIMDVTDVSQARIAEDAGAIAVMALERVPSDIRAQGGVARMSDPQMIEDIKNALSIPVMAKARIGHFVEAQILESLNIDFIDESEVLTPSDYDNHIWKHDFKIPFVCGARNLAEALRRIEEGACLIRTKGEAGTGDIIEAVRHMRTINNDIRALNNMSNEELLHKAKELGVSYELLKDVSIKQSLIVPNFSAGGIATPSDAALMMQLGAESVFVGSGIFKSSKPKEMAEAIVKAVANYKNPDILARLSKNLGEPMYSINISNLNNKERFASRGW